MLLVPWLILFFFERINNLGLPLTFKGNEFALILLDMLELKLLNSIKAHK
jgi:hypothetical protein